MQLEAFSAAQSARHRRADRVAAAENSRLGIQTKSRALFSLRSVTQEAEALLENLGSRAEHASEKTFQLDNHLGTVAVECDATGSVISYEEYHPYGTCAYRAFQSSEVSARRYRYTGKERDEETSLSYYGARYYAPWLGRWTAADPAGLVDGPGLYTYCRGSPVTLHDPSGNEGVVVEELHRRPSRASVESEFKTPGGAGPKRREITETVRPRTITEETKRPTLGVAGEATTGAQAGAPAVRPKELPPVVQSFLEHTSFAARAPTEPPSAGEVAIGVAASVFGYLVAPTAITVGGAVGGWNVGAGVTETAEAETSEAQARGVGRTAAGAVDAVLFILGMGGLARGAKPPVPELTSRSGGTSEHPRFDPAKLQRIQKALSAEGVTFAEDVARLEAAGAEALYDVPEAGGPGTIVLRPNPSRMAVIEELTHLGQHRKAGFPSRAEFAKSPKDVARIEMQAVQKILNPGGHQRRGIQFTYAETMAWIRNWNIWRVRAGGR